MLPCNITKLSIHKKSVTFHKLKRDNITRDVTYWHNYVTIALVLYYSSTKYPSLSVQGMAYATFATSLAAAQGSLIALTGVKQLQWEKLCHFYPRFCVQAAVGIVIGAISSVVMVIISSISAYHLFRLYPSSNHQSLSGVARWSLF